MMISRGIQDSHKVSFGEFGFTLMEIMVVIIILGVLAGLATPAYQKTIRKARTSEAVTNLKTLHMGQKIYRVDNGSFYGPQSTLATINTSLSIDLESQFYTLNIPTATASTYCATATETGVVGPAFVYYVNQTGVTTTTKPAPCP